MIDGVDEQVPQWLVESLEDLSVDLQLVADQLEPDLLASTPRNEPDELWERARQLLESNGR